MSDKSDLIDHSAEVSQQLLDGVIGEARRKAQREYHPGFDGVHCVEEDCGAEIPQARIDAGRVRCVDCQALIEKRQGRGWGVR